MLAILVVLASAGLIYLLPTVIAIYRDHPNRWLVGAINVMTGLTVLGWLFALREALKPLQPPATALPQPAPLVAGPAIAKPTGVATPMRQMGQLAFYTPIPTQISQLSQRRTNMGFFASIGSAFGKYATFSGRASRSEFWYFQLFFCLALAVSFFGGVYGIGLAFILLYLPEVTVQVRRLHDTEHSGWWIFAQVIPICAFFPLLIWYCRKGTDGANRFGAGPLQPIIEGQVYVATAPTTMTEKAEQLAKIKGLLESGTITQEEFDRMKADVLAS